LCMFLPLCFGLCCFSCLLCAAFDVIKNNNNNDHSQGTPHILSAALRSVFKCQCGEEQYKFIVVQI